MIQKLLKNPNYRPLATKHMMEFVTLLLEEGIEFGIIIDAPHVTFDPPLPPEIASNLVGMTHFILGGYSFESAYIQDRTLHFEAGFGPNNFASHVSAPLEAIVHIVIDEMVVHLNFAATLLTKLPTDARLTGSEDHSLKSFLSNPENQKFLRP
ncbi:MAG: hypothetical protein K6347_03205 [Campylobacterales bacterium]